MKKTPFIFALCLALCGLNIARADDTDTARAATRRPTGGTVTANSSTTRAQGTSQTGLKSRGIGATSQSSLQKSGTPTSRTTATGRGTTAITDGARRATASAVTSRQATVAPRTTATPTRTVATSPRSGAGLSRTATVSRTPTQPAIRTTGRISRTATIARSADTTSVRDAVMNRDYQSCKTVYYDCMDEFCANKDNQLKRCACSSRIHEFDNVKKQLTWAEDKMLDFNQRLLTVNMDKEDAEALFTATEGELAFNGTKDTSDSKKILDEIAKKLKTGSTDDSFNQNLSAITLSLNADAAFDNVDSLMGVTTTTKEGTALYGAALPVCREMAAEVCAPDELELAISGYQMAIEQDCNTVRKSYETQTDQAREKIREGSALLDMSRLDIHQKRNSDDILTCKKKMLTQLSDTSVCGENLGKCLDTTGHYIDPSTGQAFLSTDLAALDTLIVRPTGDQSWTTAPGNREFVRYLNGKKKYLEPAMENCQDIADSVWDAFIEDALAQIKLAQEAKLEEVRQSCTTLTTQCLTNTAKSLEDFDARALSTFGVAADKTVNAMCDSVQSACSALLGTTGGDEDWVGGMTQIKTEKTYDTIIKTCREVGRACIIQVCKSISGNFGLCENMDTSNNRKSIINRDACWPEVLKCVRAAGEDSINRIFAPENVNSTIRIDEKGTFYEDLYGIRFSDINRPGDVATSDTGISTLSLDDDPTGTAGDVTQTQPTNQTPCYQTTSNTCLDDLCATECGCNYNGFDNQCSETKSASLNCRTCRIAERIWGNCETSPNKKLDAKGSHNKIIFPQSPTYGLEATITQRSSTLLGWFAINTGTDNLDDSCRNTECPAGHVLRVLSNSIIVCESAESYDGTKTYCPKNSYDVINTGYGTNCCRAKLGSEEDGLTAGQLHNTNTNLCCVGTWQKRGNALFGLKTDNTVDATNDSAQTCVFDGFTNQKNVIKIDDETSLVCVGNLANPDTRSDAQKAEDAATKYPSGQQIRCNGIFVYVNQAGHHTNPNPKSAKAKAYMYYKTTDKNICECTSDCDKDGSWHLQSNRNETCARPSGWLIGKSDEHNATRAPAQNKGN